MKKTSPIAIELTDADDSVCSVNDLCFRHFSVEDGLSSNSVRALMQDKYGFLWIGTDEGLNRYDGTTVKTL